MNGKRLLLVEDNKKVQSFNEELLTKQGFDGLDFLKELRQTSNIPVLMLTGYGLGRLCFMPLSGGVLCRVDK